MSSEATTGRSESPSRVPATVWLRRWQVEEEALTVRIDDVVEWKCVRPSEEAIALAAAAGVALTAEVDTYAEGIASSVFCTVRGQVAGILEVRTEESRLALVARDAVSTREMISITAAPGFIVTVLCGTDVPAMRA